MNKISVGMIVEGSYPYIVGGVASWCQNLIQNLKNIDFIIIAILPDQYKEKNVQYKLPDNVIDFKKIWLGSFSDDNKKIFFPKNKCKKNNKQFFDEINFVLEQLSFNNYRFFETLARSLFPIDQSEYNFEELFASKHFYELLKKYYYKYYSHLPFMPYFWTIQSILQPLYKLGSYKIPKADCYHIISTGYAGYIGVLAKVLNKSPLLLTEHGIYVNERRDEINDSDKIKKEFKDIWNIFFKHLCSLSYQFCDKVITLYQNNAISEIEENCNPSKIQIIPNGINLDIFSKIEILEDDKINVGIVARVVPIKDVMTFIRSVKYVIEKNNKIHFYIIGPTDEDPEYYNKCMELVDELNVNEFLTFTGKVNMKEYYAKIKIMVLTSVREAQPLTIMEAMAAGIPCVSSNVGSCSELLEGTGFITPSKSPEMTGESILKLVNNKYLYDTLSKRSKEKAINDYDWKNIVEEYGNIYKTLSEKNVCYV